MDKHRKVFWFRAWITPLQVEEGMTVGRDKPCYSEAQAKFVFRLIMQRKYKLDQVFIEWLDVIEIEPEMKIYNPSSPQLHMYQQERLF